MKKNLPSIRKSSKVSLQKSKSLITITRKILSKDDWMQHLWDWADENEISDLEWVEYNSFRGGRNGYWSGIPRERDKLLNLEKLRLYNCQISNLANEICYLDRLIIISITECKLNELPNRLYSLKNLRWLDIHKCDFLFIPDVVFGLYTLNKLTFSNNKIQTIPKEIANLTNLSDLDFNGNMVEEMPKELCLLSKLDDLDFGNNKLIELPKEIGNLVELFQLDLNNNKLLSIPKEIGKLVNLGMMILSENKLTYLPKEVGLLADLHILGIDENDLVELPEEICNLTNLTRLNLEHNTNLILTMDQKEWIHELIEDGCRVTMDDDLLEGTSLVANPYQEEFDLLVQSLCSRDYDLGNCFERNISFKNFKNGKLTWASAAANEDKEMLITNWSLIKMFINDIFGSDTKIINISQKQ